MLSTSVKLTGSRTTPSPRLKRDKVVVFAVVAQGTVVYARVSRRELKEKASTPSAKSSVDGACVLVRVVDDGL